METGTYMEVEVTKIITIPRGKYCRVLNTDIRCGSFHDFGIRKCDLFECDLFDGIEITEQGYLKCPKCLALKEIE
jgi:hypothetical protein